MANTQSHLQERIAPEHLTQLPLFLGIDGDEAAHYWDSYERALVVVQDGSTEKVELAETPFETLDQWCEHTREERGWTIGPHVGGSLVADLVRGFDA